MAEAPHRRQDCAEVLQRRRTEYRRPDGRGFWRVDRRHKVDQIADIEPLHVAAYVEVLGTRMAKPTVKQHLAAVRMCFDWLVTGGVLTVNPAHAVRGPKHVVKRGKTPVLTVERLRGFSISAIGLEASGGYERGAMRALLAAGMPARQINPFKLRQFARASGATDQARVLLDSIDTSTLVGLRDRALIGVMTYAFARVSAVVAMRVEDYFANGKRWWVRLHEKGGKRHEMPAHHKLEAYLDEYVRAAGIAGDDKGPLFRSARGRTGELRRRRHAPRRCLAHDPAPRRRTRHEGQDRLPHRSTCRRAASAPSRMDRRGSAPSVGLERGSVYPRKVSSGGRVRPSSRSPMPRPIRTEA
jgi:site-specific recombinase XerC